MAHVSAHPNASAQDLLPGTQYFPGVTRPNVFVARLLLGWRLVLAGAVLGALAAGATLFVGRNYVAETLVAPLQARNEVQFEPTIKTVPSSQADAALARRQTLVDLVSTPELEGQVIAELSGSLPADQLVPGELRKRVHGILRTQGDLIAIDASTDDPNFAVMIANAWTDKYVQAVNRVYAGRATGTSLDSLRSERDNALTDYNTAQAALADEVNSNQADALQNQIKDQEHRLLMLRSAYQAGSFTGEQQVVTQPDPNKPNTSSSAPTLIDPAFASTDYRLAELKTINDLASTLRRLDATRANIQGLLTAGSGSSDGPALAIVKAQLVAINDGLPSTIQFQVASASSSSGTADELQTLTDSIDRARAQLSADLNDRRAAYEARRAADAAVIDADLRSLKSQFEAADGRRKDLTLKRDVAWDSYSALARKVEEQRVTEATSGLEVQVASHAAFADSVRFISTPAAIALGALAGLLLTGLILTLPLLMAYGSRNSMAVAPGVAVDY